MTYSAFLTYKTRGNATFEGVHFYDSTKGLGRVDWLIHWTPDAEPEPFMLVFNKPAQSLHTVTSPATSAVNCSLSSYERPLFQTDWAKNASYVGALWFNGRLCNVWDDVYPFFIQGRQLPSRFYADFFTGLPVAFDNKDNLLTYGRDIDTTPPDTSLFYNIANLDCPPGEEIEALRVLL